MKAILRRTTTMLCAAVMAVPMALSVYASIPDPTSGVKFDDSAVISNESGISIGGGDTDQPVTSSDYTITIPATFDIANSGWNEIGEIKAGGTLENGKKLVVTATSANDWALKSGENEVSYEMMNYEDDSAPATSWEFTDLPASQSIGVNVEDYSGKPAGSYTDTVTFTASVESAEYVPQTFTSLSDGDILRVGDTLEVASGGYDFRDDGYSLKAWNAPYTVLRANVEGLGDPTMMPTVTEDVNGAYYVIKGNNNNYYDFEGRLAATDTSDGVIITKKDSYWAINVYEP
ncbi:hypothetical protein [Ruminococcus albus]|uniref:Uncharacterized protein n=1 Tax=Ruminococcus albus 8 TaxID=246199 RepID=E9SE88_RUMAL|nr:hypothetical protein [Ruminococcus albus]EGC02365.1 hypothetical protein CUS_5998 [Ruminococcus albus 8]MCC3351183.1 hypothetical protein [Ruminococcus albus 8]